MRPMGRWIEKPFNLSGKKMLRRERNLTPDRDVLMKGRCQYHFLGMGDQTKTVGRLDLCGSAVTGEK